EVPHAVVVGLRRFQYSRAPLAELLVQRVDVVDEDVDRALTRLALGLAGSLQMDQHTLRATSWTAKTVAAAISETGLELAMPPSSLERLPHSPLDATTSLIDIEHPPPPRDSPPVLAGQ